MSDGLPLLAALVFACGVVDTAAGFGGMVVVIAFGALWFPVPQLVAVMVPVNLALAAFILARYFRVVAWGFLGRRLFPAMGPGLCCGLVVTSFTNPQWLKPAFALFVAAVAAHQLRQLKADARPSLLHPWVARAWLFGGGLVHGIFATGGPPTVYVASRELPDKGVFRASLNALWVVLNLILIAKLWGEHRLELKTSALMLVPIAIGMTVGEWIHHRLDERRFRLAVTVLLLGAGLVLFVSSVRAR